MQQIERYGVIALLLVLVTVLGVTMWSSGEDDANSPARLAAETKREASNPTKGPEKAPLRVGPARRNTNRVDAGPATKRNGASSNLAQGSAPKSGDIKPIGRPSAGPGRMAQGNSSLASTPTTVAGKRKAETPAGPTAAEREEQARIAKAALASKRSNRPRNRRNEAANRVIANPIQPSGQPTGGKPVRDARTTTNRPGKPRADYLAKQQAKREPLRPVSNFVQPSNTPSTTQAGGAREYTVRSGDTLSAIASRELGSAKLWPQIERANPKLNPKRLMVGTKILLPDLARTHSNAAVAALEAGALTYTVKSGDVLSKISQSVLGTSKRWTEIRDLNPKVDPDRLHVGTVLILPSGASAPSPVRAAVSSEPRVAASTPRRGKKGVVR